MITYKDILKNMTTPELNEIGLVYFDSIVQIGETMEIWNYDDVEKYQKFSDDNDNKINIKHFVGITKKNDISFKILCTKNIKDFGHIIFKKGEEYDVKKYKKKSYLYLRDNFGSVHDVMKDVCGVNSIGNFKITGLNKLYDKLHIENEKVRKAHSKMKLKNLF